MQKRLWVTWEVQRRNRSMSTMLGATLHELVLDAPSWRRYPVLMVRTIWLYARSRADLIFAQNPSLILAGLTVLMAKLMRTPVIIDAHNAGLFPLEGRSRLLNALARRINNMADRVIVSNAQLQHFVENSGGKAAVIPDPMPDITCGSTDTGPADTGPEDAEQEVTETGFEVVFVCSWADDEPYREVIDAVRGLPEHIRVYMTGNDKGRAQSQGAELPSNIVLTGFIPDAEYDALICGCDAVMVLTTRDDCLVCGAYEAAAIGKPMILSDSSALRNYFDQGCIYAQNSASGIRQAITQMIEQQASLRQDIVVFKRRAESDMSDRLQQFEATLQTLA